MPVRDVLLALIVVLTWGFNFVVIKWGLAGLPPLLLAALRFAAVVLPAIFFLPRPAVDLKWIMAFGLAWGVCQFGFLFNAMHLGMPAGLASLVLQSQAFFTLMFAAIWLNEQPRLNQLLGLILAAGGLMLIGNSHGQSMTLAGFVMTLCGAAGWAVGNIVMKRIARQGAKIDQIAFIVWASVPPLLVFSVLTLWLDGPTQVSFALTHLSRQSVFAVLYQAFIATIIGMSLWNKLLTHHPANRVAPFSLLVPWVGLSCSVILLNEQLQIPQWIGAILLMAGLLINVLGMPKLARLRKA